MAAMKTPPLDAAPSPGAVLYPEEGPQQAFFRQLVPRVLAEHDSSERVQAPSAARQLATALPGSLIHIQLAAPADRLDYEGGYDITADRLDLTGLTPELLLEGLLEGFINHQPAGVQRLMRVRNLLMNPFGEEMSSLGCPVFSLMSSDSNMKFAMRFPVRGDRIEPHRAQVVLGTDAEHVFIRTCVGVEITDERKVRFSLEMRVSCRNLFGAAYLRLTGRLYRRYIIPMILQYGVDYLCCRQAAFPTMLSATASATSIPSTPADRIPPA